MLLLKITKLFKVELVNDEAYNLIESLQELNMTFYLELRIKLTTHDKCKWA